MDPHNTAGKWKLVQKHIDEINNDPDCLVKAEFADENSWHHIIGTIKGPPGSPYEGGTFKVRLMLKPNFPLAPPSGDFITKIYHPNITWHTGAICLDTLQNNWSPVMRLRTVLMTIQQLLESPNPDSPLEPAAADDFRRDRQMFFRKARQAAIDYAGAPAVLPPKNAAGNRGGSAGPSEFAREDIQAIMNLGLNKEQAVFALGAAGFKPGRKLTGNELNLAVDLALGML